MKLEYVENVGVLSLDHAPVNALGLEHVQQVTQLLRSVRKQTPVVITGAGAAFCAGVDTKAFATYDPDTRANLVIAITSMIAELLNVSAPVIAAVNGHALGGGLVLALCSDYRIASENVENRLGLTEAQAGVPFPIGALEVIRHELEPGMLRRLTLSSRTLDPVAALEANIVDELADDASVLERSLAMATQIHLQPGFTAVKQQMKGDLANRVRELADRGQDPLAESMKS